MKSFYRKTQFAGTRLATSLYTTYTNLTEYWLVSNST